jgi:hypothetical protein
MARSHNEDAVATDATMGLAVIADGMGGFRAGYYIDIRYVSKYTPHVAGVPIALVRVCQDVKKPQTPIYRGLRPFSVLLGMLNGADVGMKQWLKNGLFGCCTFSHLTMYRQIYRQMFFCMYLHVIVLGAPMRRGLFLSCHHSPL